MCIACRALNNIKYRHLIPRLNDLLDEVYDLAYFQKIDLRSRCHGLWRGDDGKHPLKQDMDCRCRNYTLTWKNVCFLWTMLFFWV